MKPHTNIGTIGAFGAGKTTLTHAIVAYIFQQGGRVSLGCDPGMTKEGRELNNLLAAIDQGKSGNFKKLYVDPDWCNNKGE